MGRRAISDACGHLPLSAQLSYVLVAFTVELDNEFEHQMPHRTTRHGSTPGHPRAPWLVSFPMWVHCMRHVPEEGTRADDLVRKPGLTAKTMQHVVKRLAAWWGYLTVESAGTASAASRWCARPNRAARHRMCGGRWKQRSRNAGATGSALSRSGRVAKMTIDNWLGALDDHGYITIGPDPAGSRFKAATLTGNGQRAQELYRRWADEVDDRLAGRFGPSACPELREALAPIIGDAGLRTGMELYPDGWRAQVPRPDVLPHYPVISMRGGFPDGS
jgi:DNA-binding MarR family transcriptional regulator